MQRRVLKRGNPRKHPGTWAPCRTKEGLKAIISCPLCGRASFLGHEIRADGTVHPSVVHAPEDGCEFHEFVTLEDWEPDAQAGEPSSG